MKHLKKFENFDLGRFSETENEKDELVNNIETVNDDEDEDYELEDETEDEDEDEDFVDEDETEDENERRRRVWGDENVVEKKKINSGFQAFLDKQKAKKKDKEDDKDTKKDKKDDKKPVKGLTAGQKKLPEAMQKAILKKQK
jgi:preprotein translocase subunit SecD